MRSPGYHQKQGINLSESCTRRLGRRGIQPKRKLRRAIVVGRGRVLAIFRVEGVAAAGDGRSPKLDALNVQMRKCWARSAALFLLSRRTFCLVPPQTARDLGRRRERYSLAVLRADRESLKPFPEVFRK